MNFYKVRKVMCELLSFTGAINYFWNRLPNGIYIFNYHRIGNKSTSLFDRGVFSCSIESFEQQVIEIKRNFIIINTLELSKLIENDLLSLKRYALITFDDGYVDNYLYAYPILNKYNISATFYLVTDFIDSNAVSWWDEMAFLLRNSLNQVYSIPSSKKSYSLVDENIEQSIRDILVEAKSHKTLGIIKILEDMREKCNPGLNKLLKGHEQLFISVEQAKIMLENNMEFGSHSVSHRILSQLSFDEQEIEIVHSKKILEDKLGTKINSFAYPVGGYHSYTSDSFDLVASAGYKVAFNNEPGTHRSISNKYDIHRFCVSSNDIDLLKFYCCFTS